MEMEFLTLIIMTPSEEAVMQIYPQLSEHLKPFLHKVKLVYKVFPSHARIQCINTAAVNWKQAEKSQLCELWSTALAVYIVRFAEEQIMQFLIRDEHGYKVEADIIKIMENSKPLLPVESEKERQKTIAKEIRSYLMHCQELNIDGLLRFRLQKYKEQLRDTVECAIDEFIMDKQYQEFISLLKYFVFMQESKIAVIHLMHHGGQEFVLHNEQMQPMELTEMDNSFRVEVLNQEFNFEDLVVSTLISVAPRQIFIHTREAGAQIIQTITQIFEDRVEICEFCEHCCPLLGEGVLNTQHLAGNVMNNGT